MNLKAMTTLQRVLFGLAAASLVAILVFTEKICFSGGRFPKPERCERSAYSVPEYDINAILVRSVAVLAVTALLFVALRPRAN